MPHPASTSASAFSSVDGHISTTYVEIWPTTAVQNEAALSYHRVRGLYFLTVVFVVTIVKGMGLWYKLRYWLGFVLGHGLR